MLENLFPEVLESSSPEYWALGTLFLEGLTAENSKPAGWILES